MTGHDHELDGKLHDGCAMCDEIRFRLDRDNRWVGVERLATHYGFVARAERRVGHRVRTYRP